MPSTITLINWVLISAVIVYVVKTTLLRKRRGPLPPGPKPKPILGNLTDLPPKGGHDWKYWLTFKELYGPISSITIFGQTLIIVNDAQIAFELLDKRSAIHSSRPRMVFAGEMVGWEDSTGLQKYSNTLRAHRKNIRGIIGSKWVLAPFYPLLDVEVRRFLFRVLENPTDFVDHLLVETGTIILKLAYGYTAESLKEDPLVSLINETVTSFSLATLPGEWLVDNIPIRMFWLTPRHKTC
jgi:hypothetical protein